MRSVEIVDDSVMLSAYRLYDRRIFCKKSTEDGHFRAEDAILETEEERLTHELSSH